MVYADDVSVGGNILPLFFAEKRNKNIHQGTYAPLTFRRKKMKSWNLMKNCKNSEQMKT